MKALKSYKETESFLFKQLPMYQRIGPKTFKIDLNNIIQLSTIIGNPHKDLNTIHIAGTNGKGSTSFFIATVLKAMGYKVGLYTSPHYKDYRERIKIDGQLVEKRFVTSFVNDLISKGLFESELKPSFFEITVAMAFSYFKKEQVDFAVIETGLGGRLDSTNIITPLLSVITNIGLDHTNFLGNTIPKIAKEKAGIIKKGVPVVIGKKQKQTEKTFAAKAKKEQTKLTYAPSSRIKISQNLLDQFPTYQKENMKTALVSLSKLKLKPTESQVKKAWTKGLKEWGFMGRYMKVGKKPLEIYDSAHNRDGLTILFSELKEERFDKLHIVIGVVSDKDLSKVLDLFPKEATYYFSQAKIPRAMKKETLQSKANAYGLTGRAYISIKKALSIAKGKANRTDLVLVCGSIFTVAEVC